MLHLSFAGHLVTDGEFIPKTSTRNPPVVYYPPTGFPQTYILYDEDARIIHGFWTGNGHAKIKYAPMNPPPGETHNYTLYVLDESADSYPEDFDAKVYRHLDSIEPLFHAHSLTPVDQLTYRSG